MIESACIFIASRDNWIDCIESKSFGLEKAPGRLKSIKPGDPCVAYVTRESIFAGIGQVTSPYYYDETAIWADGAYPHRINIEIDLDFENTVDVRSLIDQLDFITDKDHWFVFFKGGIAKIPLSDFEVIKGAIGRQKLRTQAEVKPEEVEEERGMDVSNAILSLPELTASSLHDRIAEMLHIIGLHMGYDSVQKYKTRPDSPYQIDVVWLQSKNPQVAMEVHHSGVLGDALNRLGHARDFNFRKVVLIVVESADHRRALGILKFDDKLKHVIDLWSTNSIYKMYSSCVSFHTLFNKFNKSVYKEEPDKNLI